MKQCAKCGTEKPLTDFYNHPAGAFGVDSKCKECAKFLSRQHRAAKIDHYKEYDRQRASRPDRVAAREAYQQTEAGKAATKRAREAYKKRAPERRKAHFAVGNAIRDGRLTAWPVCALPECSSKPEAHHPDYSAPLSVVWLCRAHHKQAHALIRHYRESV